MKVLYIGVSSEFGGAGRSMLEMVSTIKKNFPEIEPVVLCSHRTGHIDLYREQGIEVYPTLHEAFNFGKEDNTIHFIVKYIPRFLRYFFRNIYALLYIKKNIDMSTIDLIHTNSIRNDIGMILSKKYNIPHILHLREFGTKGFDYNVKYYRRNPIEYVDKRVTHYIAITKAVKEHWINYNNIAEEKISVVYNGINDEKISKAPLEIKPNEPIKIVMTGYVMPSKGQEQLIRALALLEKETLKGIKVDIIGDGEPSYIATLKKMVMDLGVNDCVSFLGRRNDVHRLLQNYHIGMICSRAEAFGRVTAEYMLAGLCVIASNTGGNVELIKHEETGLLYKYGDTNDLKSVICYAMDNQEVLRRVADNGYHEAKKKYVTKLNAQNVVEVYKEIMRH